MQRLDLGTAQLLADDLATGESRFHVLNRSRFHWLIWLAWTPYYFANSESVNSSRIASKATFALKAAEWFFLFFIADQFLIQSIHLNIWHEFLGLPLIAFSACGKILLKGIAISVQTASDAH